MKILHLINGNMASDDGYTQRVKRQESLWNNDIKDIDLYIFNIISWKLLLKIKRKHKCVEESKQYAKSNNYKYKYIQGYPLQLFLLTPNIYFYMCARKIYKYCKKNKINTIYAENLICGYTAYICKKKYKISYYMDYHGVAPEEFLLTNKALGRINYSYYKKMERNALESADGIVCVSNRFREYITSNFNVNPNQIIIAPSCIEINRIGYSESIRKTVRKKLKIENDYKVIVYAGGCGHWHCDDQIIQLFGKIYKKYNTIYFIFLTNQSNHTKIIQNFTEANIPKTNYFVGYAPNEKIPEYYSASDFGIIIRNNSIINKVASPTKVIEYMASGLGIISTSNIGDIEDLPATSFLEKYEKLCDRNYDTKKIIQFIEKGYDREKNLNICKTFLKNEYTWESMANRYRYLFSLKKK